MRKNTQIFIFLTFSVLLMLPIHAQTPPPPAPQGPPQLPIDGALLLLGFIGLCLGLSKLNRKTKRS